MFSGGDYGEVARWLENFVTSHAKHEDLHAECVLDSAGPREGASYGVRVRVGELLSPKIELDFPEVARSRGELAWCQRLADRVRGLTREAAAGTRGAPRPA